MIIRLNKSFYTAEAVEEALKDFSGVCRGRAKNDLIDVELESDKETVCCEFCNYVLALMKHRGM
ncbi:MAG: HxsD-like protein [Candidatus Woesearchaeota archaeon]